jgi:hypothetical protein
MLRSCLCAVLLLLASGTSAQVVPSEAQRAEASEHFRAGVDLFRATNYRAALVELTRAYELTPDYRVLYNIAQAHLALGDAVQASQVYTFYLEQGGILIEPRRRREVEAELLALEGRIATLSLRSDLADGELFVDERAIGPSPLARDVRVAVGVHLVTVRTPSGASTSQRVEVLAGERKLVTFAVQAKAPSEPPAQASQSPGLGRRTRWGIGLLSAGVALGLAGGAAWLVSKEARDEYEKSGSNAQLERADALLLGAEIAGGTGIALTATSVVLFLTVLTELTSTKGETPDAQESEEARLSFGIGPGSAALYGRF